MLKHIDDETDSIVAERALTIPANLSRLVITYDHGRFSLHFNGATTYHSMIGTSDFTVEVDNEEPSEAFREKHVCLDVECTCGHESVAWVPHSTFSLYTRSGTHMSLVIFVCPLCNTEHIGRVFTDPEFLVTRVETDNGNPSPVLYNKNLTKSTGKKGKISVHRPLLDEDDADTHSRSRSSRKHIGSNNGKDIEALD